MTHAILMQTTPEEIRFSKRMSAKYGRDMSIYEVPLKNFVSVDSNLIEKKVASLVIEGAVDEAGFWRNLVYMHTMTAEIEEVPIHSMRNYKVRRGQQAGSEKEESGGSISRVKLDVSGKDKERYVYLTV